MHRVRHLRPGLPGTCFSCEIFCPEQIVDVHPSVKNRPRPW
jgi:hypothetical protein